MRTKTSLLILFLILSGCSTPQPENKWQYDAAASCHDYQEHFLKNSLLRARSDLYRARHLASQSAHLHTRIDIELSVCAMELSVLNPGPCDIAEKLLRIEPNTEQLAYLHLLTSSLEPEETDHLPKQYRSFAQALLAQDPKKTNDALMTIEPLSSQLISSALAIELLDEKSLQKLVDGLSYHGYKNPLLVWLEIQIQKETDPQKRARLKAKLELLTSN